MAKLKNVSQNVFSGQRYTEYVSTFVIILRLSFGCTSLPGVPRQMLAFGATLCDPEAFRHMEEYWAQARFVQVAWGGVPKVRTRTQGDVGREDIEGDVKKSWC